MVAETLARFGRIDIIVNAVGGGAGKVLHPGGGLPARRTGTGSWSSTSGARSLPTQAAVRTMIEAGHGGAVLNISSVRANLGINAGYSAYVAAKGAISSLTRQWATEWAKHGIRVNAIMPTFVDTPQVAIAARGPGVQGRDRRAASRSAASARPATSSGRRSSCVRTPRRS